MAKRILKYAIPIGFLLYLVTAVFHAHYEKERLKAYSPPGQLLDVHGKLMHMYCLGEYVPDTPTIILEAGTGDNHLTWYGLQEQLSREYLTCSYDRLGYGWSDSSFGIRTVDRIAEELYGLLQSAQVPPPYVMVGHSFGGLVVQYFATRYPDTVLALVLVDATPASTLLSRQSGIRRPLLLVPPALTGLAAALQGAGLFRLFYEKEVFDPFEALLPLPEEIRMQGEATYFRTRTLAASALEQLYLRKSATLTVGQDLPVNMPVIAFISNQEGASEMLPRIQAEFTALTANSRAMVLQNGHYLHLERPDLVQAAIKSLARTHP